MTMDGRHEPFERKRKKSKTFPCVNASWPFASSWKGAEKPEVVLVEFYDYACPYCKASNPHVDRLLKEKPGLRVVYRELPILGDNSIEAITGASCDSFTASRNGAMASAGLPPSSRIWPFSSRK